MTPFLILLGLSALTACASGEPVETERKPDITEIARALGCTSDQIAVCIDVNCEPEDYQCADRGNARDLFGAGDHWHR